MDNKIYNNKCLTCGNEHLIEFFNNETGESQEHCGICGYTRSVKIKLGTDGNPLYIDNVESFDNLIYETIELSPALCSYSIDTSDGMFVSSGIKNKKELRKFIKIMKENNIPEKNIKFSFYNKSNNSRKVYEGYSSVEKDFK